MRGPLLRLLPLLALLTALGIALAFDLHHIVSLEGLRHHREAVVRFVDRHPQGAVLAFAALYAGWVALSIPGAFVLTMVAGFLFGTVTGAAVAVIGGTIGATTVFLAVRYALAGFVRNFAGLWLQRLRAGFERNAFSYMLMLRVAPIFPFFAINIAPALLGMRARAFVIATLIGIIPACLVYASIGAGLGAILDSDADLDAAAVLTPEMLLALSALAALSLLPILVHRFRRR